MDQTKGKQGKKNETLPAITTTMGPYNVEDKVRVRFVYGISIITLQLSMCFYVMLLPLFFILALHASSLSN
jgi:hypothetical protein